MLAEVREEGGGKGDGGREEPARGKRACVRDHFVGRDERGMSRDVYVCVSMGNWAGMGWEREIGLWH
jgi:hypothetical protein